MKRMICAAVVTAMLCGAAGAAAGSYKVKAELDPEITVKIDGAERTFFNVQGQEVHPISYAGTTYVPLRSIGELMGKNVNWDQASYTATIGGPRVTPDASGKADVNARNKPIDLQMEPSYTIIIDGVKRTFRDANGKQVDPALYNGSIYLPIRAIGEIMGKTVGWDGASRTVTLSGAAGGEVTDADTTNPTTPSGANTPAGAITVERAKQIALDHAKVTASQATFVKAERDYDDGRLIYEIEFYVSGKNGWLEYDYEIDAMTGAIRSMDRDAESSLPAGQQQSGSGANCAVSASAAQQTALARVPGANAAHVQYCRLERDDDRWHYDCRIVYNGMEYECKIDANTGAILEWDAESIYD